MATIRIKQVDTFTNTPHYGNPAGVVLSADGLTDEQMRSIAREINLSETAFILSPQDEGNHLRIRWFTPLGEQTMSGHATIAALHALAEEGEMNMKEYGDYQFNIETASDVIPARVNKGENRIWVSLYLKPPDLEKASLFKVDLVRLFNISINDIDSSIPIQRNGFLFAPIRRLHTLFGMKPNFDEIMNFLGKRDFYGLCVYTTETLERTSLVHSRVFAPHVGVTEDAVTGFTHTSLAQFLLDKRLVSEKEGRYAFRSEQGDVLGRKGRVDVELLMDGNDPLYVIVSGCAVTVIDGEMLLPELTIQ